MVRARPLDSVIRNSYHPDMSTHQSTVPPVAARYFRDNVHGYLGDRDDHPLIAATFVPSRGWKRYPGQKRISGSWVRKLRAAGATHIALTTHGRTADFSAAELLRREITVGLGHQQNPPDNDLTAK